MFSEIPFTKHFTQSLVWVKVQSMFPIIMIIESKLNKKGSGLIVLAKCMSAVTATLISVKRHVKVILEKKILAHSISTCYCLKK